MSYNNGYRMMCKKCKTILRPTDTFCPNCGCSTNENNVVPTAESKRVSLTGGFDDRIPVIGGSLDSIGIVGIIIIIVAALILIGWLAN